MSLRTASLALLAGLTLAAPTAAFASPPTTTAHVERTATPAPAPAPAPSEDAARYADREARSDKVADYEGGNVVIVISGGALFVALLVLLLLF